MVERDERQSTERWRKMRRRRPQAIEAPGPGQESVWNYPRPPRVERVRERVRVQYAGVTLADSTRCLRVCETSSPPVYYLPPADVAMRYLRPCGAGSICEWKGQAHYWNVEINGRIIENAAWSYPRPWAGFEAIRDHLAFYAGKMDACYVGEVQVTPQAGRFYGGWITPDLVGPFKGEPGTEHW